MSYQFVSQRDTHEYRTGADGVGVERREVREVVRKKAVTSYEDTNDNGTSQGSLTFLWNGTTHIKMLSGNKRYICANDEIVRSEIPGNGGERVQVWVYYSPWETFTDFDPE